jgi:hypothetical protein
MDDLKIDSDNNTVKSTKDKSKVSVWRFDRVSLYNK